MIQLLRFLNQCIKNSLVTSCVLSLSLAVIPAALADYQPDPTQPPPKGNTTSSGPRGGCESIDEPPLTVLAPHKHVGLTTSTHPTFAWFVPNSKPFPMEFTLFAYGPDNNLKLVQKISLKSSPGIMKLSLPKDKPGLALGQSYLWQVSISCNPNSPSSDVVAEAEIQVVEMSPTLKNALSATENRLERAKLYAEAGLWYNALSEALGSAENARLGQVASTLLEDLAKLEKPEDSQILRELATSKR